MSPMQMSAKWLVVMKKELREALRDRRTLTLVLLFSLLYPALVGFILHKVIERETRVEREGVELVVVGGAQAPTLMAQLRQKNITVDQRSAITDKEVTALLAQKKVAAVLKLTGQFGDNYNAMRPAALELWFNSAGEKDAQRVAIEIVLRDYSMGIAGARLLARGVSPATLAPIRVQRYDTADNAARAGSAISKLLGMFFVPVFFFGLSLAIDSTAGERERRSLEVLMAQPVRAFDLIAGKWLAAATLAFVGMAIEMVAAHYTLRALPLEEIGMSWRLSLPMLALVIGSALPLCLLVAALQIGLAMNARTFKEAQTITSMAAMLPLMPAAIVPMLDLTTQRWMYAVPVLSNQTLFQELAKGQWPGALALLLTCSSALALTACAIAFTTWRMKSERYVLSV